MTGHGIDMLHGKLWDKILRFAFPLVLTGILQQLFNTADLAVVGRFAGENGRAAMAAIGLNGPLIGIMLGTVLGISLGTNIVVAHAVGRNDRATIRRALHTSIFFALIMGGVLTGAMEALAVPILASQDVPEEVFPMALTYFRIFVAGVPVILLYNFVAAAFRGIGDTRTPLLILTFAGALNVVLNILFVVVFHMTVDGVAYATLISNTVSASVLFALILRGRSGLTFRLRALRITFPVLGRILHLGIPAGIQCLVFCYANMMIQKAINSLGTVIIAASTAAFTIEIFAYIVLNSFTQACTTFVGQNHGAGLPGRCKRVLGVCYLEGIIATVSAAALILLFGHRILSLFTADVEVIDIGYFRLLVVFFSYLFTFSYEVACGYLRGFGISILPAVLIVFGVCGVRVAWILTAFPRHPTFHCIMMAYPLSLSTTALMMFLAVWIIKPARRMKTAKRKGSGLPHCGVPVSHGVIE
ncbi:MAG: MATE family efflux transporter [Kiritimatiellae bacterium]|nr:MATE family efflux transporter [Kiritimatiellia bacterium]